MLGKNNRAKMETICMEEVLFQPGDIIVPSTSPFVKVLYASHKGRLCDNCLKSGPLHPCTGCGWMYYCGKDCQDQDWKEGHSIECKSGIFSQLPKINEAILQMDMSVLLRLLAKFHLQPESFQEKHTVFADIQRSFGDMMANEDRLLKDSRTMAFLEQMNHALHLDPTYRMIKFDEAFLRRLHGVFETNAFSIVSEGNVGGGLYISHSALNHSCRPNAYRACQFGKLEIRCVHPIPKGVEPTICYIATDGKHSPEERRSLLKKNYDFTCMCELCMAEISGPLVDYSRFKHLEDELNCLKLTEYQPATVILAEGLDLLRKLYYEYDERITFFCYRYFRVLYLFNKEFRQVPADILRKAAADLEMRLRISPGIDSFFYSNFQSMLIELEN